MSAANTDNFMQVAVAGSETTLTAPGKAVGASSLNLTSGSGWPTGTGIIFALRRVDSNGNYVAGTYTEWAGVLSGTTITLNTTPLYGTDQTYAADGLTQAYIPVSASLWNRLINTLLGDHFQNGGHSNLHDTNGNVILALAAVAAAVNDIQVSNNITTKNPSLTAAGSDSDIGIDIISKGNGVSRIDGSAPKVFIQNGMGNYIESGCLWTADAAGSTLLASMSSGVVWIAGKRLTVAAVSHRAFTASKDTYVDFQDNGDGTATITYTEVTNNAASPALANSGTTANTVRDGTIVTGASNIAASTSIGQGGFANTVPTISSQTLKGNDTLGNVIYPAGPSLATKTVNPYKFSVWKNGNQTITANTWQKVNLDTTVFDTGANFDVATNHQFTAPVAGYYLFNGAVALNGLADGNIFAAGLNIGTFSSTPTYEGNAGNVGSASGPSVTITAFVQLAAGQTVQLYVYSAQTTVVGAQYQTWLQGFLVSES